MNLTPLFKVAAEIFGQKPVQFITGAALGGAIAFFPSYNHEHAKLGQKPIAFSEIGQTRRCVKQYPDAQYTDYCGKIAMKYGFLSSIPPLTDFYAGANDTYMMVAEANNISREQWGSPDHFAYELEKKVDTSLRVHTQIGTYADKMPQLAAAARQSLTPMIKARAAIEPTVAALDATWEEDHDDVYRTVYSRSCDSKGQNCTTTSSQVYDHTDHSYIFVPRSGAAAEQRLKSFVGQHPDITVSEKLIQPWRTEAENEWAMRESRRHLPGYKDPKQDDYLRWARTWATGSNFMTYGNTIYQFHGALNQDLISLHGALQTAHSESYSTYSHSDPGPREYQITQMTLKDASGMHDDIARIENGINVAETTVPQLRTEIVQYVNAKLHHRGKVGDLQHRILRDADTIYKANYEGGFKTSLANWWAVALWTVLGGAVGAGIAGGIGKLAEDRGYSRPGRSTTYGYDRFDR